MEIIDSYIHCGLRKYQPIERVREVLHAVGVHRAVLVQHLGEWDNSYIGQIAGGEPDHFAGVCLVDHAARDAVDILQQQFETGCFRGVRFTTEVLAAAPQLFHAAMQMGLVIVLYAPNGIIPYVARLDQLFQQYPDASLVLTHLGNPDPHHGPHFMDYRDLWRLAQYPRIYFQLSGMTMFCPYGHEPLYPLIGQAAIQFGTARLLWGSNYPVVGDQTDYVRDLHLLIDGKLPLPANSIPAIAGENARRLWFSNQPEENSVAKTARMN